jgi:hypothetical protein
VSVESTWSAEREHRRGRAGRNRRTHRRLGRVCGMGRDRTTGASTRGRRTEQHRRVAPATRRRLNTEMVIVSTIRLIGAMASRRARVGDRPRLAIHSNTMYGVGVRAEALKGHLDLLLLAVFGIVRRTVTWWRGGCRRRAVACLGLRRGRCIRRFTGWSGVAWCPARRWSWRGESGGCTP